MFDVSVIIPTFNRAHLLGDAIDSCLRQETANLCVEVVVVDDHSTDATADVLAHLGHRVAAVVLPENRRQSHARNVNGLARATGRFVKFLDSDDVLEDGSLRNEAEVGDAFDADIVVTGHGTVAIGESDGQGISRRCSPCRYEDLEPADFVLLGRAEPTSAALYRRGYIAGLRWDETLSKLDDWHWFAMAALRGGKIARLDRLSYWIREHSGSRMTTESTMLKNAREHHHILRSIEREIDRQGILTVARRRRLAQYYYKELRVLSLHDLAAFEWAVEHIRGLDPNFAPLDEECQWLMRAFARVVGFRAAIMTHSVLKRAVRGFTRAER